MHRHLGYDGTIPYDHDHAGADSDHSHRHGHPGYGDQTHDHQIRALRSDDGAPPDPGTGELEADHDHDPVPDCGHLGDDVGTSRVQIVHQGRTWLLCGPCGAGFDWEAVDAVVDPGRVPGRGGQQVVEH